MKIETKVPAKLLAEAKRVAARDDVSLDELIEVGLRREVEQRRSAAPVFHLRDASFNGEGLHPDIQDLTWSEIRDLAYRSEIR